MFVATLLLCPSLQFHPEVVFSAFGEEARRREAELGVYVSIEER